MKNRASARKSLYLRSSGLLPERARCQTWFRLQNGFSGLNLVCSSFAPIRAACCECWRGRCRIRHACGGSDLAGGAAFFSGRQACQGSRVLRDCFGYSAVEDALPLPAAFDKTGVREDFQVMGDSGGSDVVQGDEFAAGEPLFGGNGLKNHKPSSISQSL